MTHVPELIVMLTHQDRTAPDALRVFDSCRDLPVQRWGFKDVGINAESMARLTAAMKDAGSTVYLEIVSLTTPEALEAVEKAAKSGIDAVMGSLYAEPIHEATRSHALDYFPFVGQVEGHPSVLSGSTESIVADARRLSERGVEGMDILTYRHAKQGGTELLRGVVQASSVPVVSAGSIDSHDRLRAVWDAGAWGFTIGSAFFDQTFEPSGSFRQNLAHVVSWLAKESERRTLSSPLRDAAP